jgi:hypothetical protein
MSITHPLCVALSLLTSSHRTLAQLEKEPCEPHAASLRAVRSCAQVHKRSSNTKLRNQLTAMLYCSTFTDVELVRPYVLRFRTHADHYSQQPVLTIDHTSQCVHHALHTIYTIHYR